MRNLPDHYDHEVPADKVSSYDNSIPQVMLRDVPDPVRASALSRGYHRLKQWKEDIPVSSRGYSVGRSANRQGRDLSYKLSVYRWESPHVCAVAYQGKACRRVCQ